jgi:hypothetical protein
MTWRELCTRAARGLDRCATRRVILWASWLLFCIYAFPGYMSSDSVDQLLQARGAPVHDWYPPVMAMIWRLTDHVISGPFPMLVLQSAAFLLGLDSIMRRVVAPRAAAVVAGSILLFPAVITQMAVIWKDCQMAGFLLAGIACVLSSERRWQVAGCGLLVLATAQRYNAPAATLPLVIGLLAWPGARTRWRRRTIAVAAWLAVTVLAFAANQALTERRTYPWNNSLALLDIAGMIARAPSSTPEAELRELTAGVPGLPTAPLAKSVRKAYRPDAWWWLSHGDGRVFDPPSNPVELEAVARAWRQLLLAHPKAYLKHRWAAWMWVLGLKGQQPAAVWEGFTENDSQLAMLSHQATHSWVQARWLSALVRIQGTVLFRPWAYLLIALALLPLCRRSPLALALLLSGIAYELSLLVVAPSADYRYSHWMIVCTITATVLAFVGRYRTRRHAVGEASGAETSQEGTGRLEDRSV